MTEPLVSIVIPCFNGEHIIGEAIESALGQTYRPIEVVVVDDGSTDRSLDRLREFGDRITLESGPNRGACAARNRGVARSQGELIQFLDADDTLRPTKLARQVPLVRAGVADLVYCDWERVGVGDGAATPCSAAPIEDPVVFALYKIIGTPNALHRRRLLEQIGGWNEALGCAQDYDLHLRLACAGATFAHLPEPLFCVRRQSESISSDSMRVTEQLAEVLWGAHDRLQEAGELTDPRAAAFAACMAQTARVYLRAGQYDTARDRFAQALRMHPSGGLDGAYGRMGRGLRRLFGPVLTERLVMFKRRLIPAAR